MKFPPTKHFLLALIPVAFSFPAFSQNANILKEDNPVIVQDRLNKLNSINGANSNILGFDNRSSEIVGDPYLFEDWLPANITFNEGIVAEGLPVNVNLLDQTLEIKTDGEVKVAYGFQLRNFELKHKEDQKFISLNHFRLAEEGERLEGYGQVLYDGKVKLVKHLYVVVKKAKYIPGFEVGSLNPEIVDKESYFLLENDRLRELKRKPDFGKWNAQMKKYMKANRLKAKREKDLIQMVKHYDSLVK